MVAAGLVDPRRNADVPSMGQLARRADLAVETVRRMVRGIGEPEPANMHRVADALNVPVERVVEWVYLSKGDIGPYQPPPDADLLTYDEREAVNRVINLFADRRKALWHATGSGKTSMLADVIAQAESLNADQRLRLVTVLTDRTERPLSDADEALEEAAYHSPEPAGQPAPEHP